MRTLNDAGVNYNRPYVPAFLCPYVKNKSVTFN